MSDSEKFTRLSELRAPKHLAWALKTTVRELDSILSHTDSCYDSWEEAKKNGGSRKIDAPNGRLKNLQKRLAKILNQFDMPDGQYGGRRGRDNISNARQHVGADILLTMDIRSFFPRISHKMVYHCLRRLGCTPDVSRLVTKLVTYRGRIPQGAPTSSVVANLVVAPLVSRLEKLATLNGASFTQYVDDITLSGPKHLSELAPVVKRIVRQEHFQLRGSKTEIRDRSEVQEVTGVRIDGGLRASERTKKSVESKLAALRSHQESGNARERLILSVQGMINYVKRFDPSLGAVYSNELDAILGTSVPG